MKDEESQSDEGDDSLAVCQGQVDVGAEPHLVVHPGDDHHVAHEAEQDHADVGTDDKICLVHRYLISVCPSPDALWQRQVGTKLFRRVLIIFEAL